MDGTKEDFIELQLSRLPCHICINFKACEDLPQPMGWCKGEKFDDGSGSLMMEDY